MATLLPYDGSAASAGVAADIVAMGGGTLVTSVYSTDAGWIGEFLAGSGSSTGRVYIGSDLTAAESPGSGAVLPQPLHGGPGRAGGGEELGGLVGLKLYMQRVAIQGNRPLVDNISNIAGVTP